MLSYLIGPILTGALSYLRCATLVLTQPILSYPIPSYPLLSSPNLLLILSNSILLYEKAYSDEQVACLGYFQVGIAAFTILLSFIVMIVAQGIHFNDYEDKEKCVKTVSFMWIKC